MGRAKSDALYGNTTRQHVDRAQFSNLRRPRRRKYRAVIRSMAPMDEARFRVERS